MQGILLPKRSIGYHPIPKTACTSIKRALYKLRTGKNFSREELGMQVHDYFNKKATDITEAKFKFIVIRDPIKRFLSGYSNRVISQKALSKEKLETIIQGKQLIAKNAIPLDPSLSDFIKYINSYETIPVIKHHIDPVTTFFDEGLDFFDKIYKIEETEKLEIDISQKYHVKFVLPRAQRSKKISVASLSKNEMEFLLDRFTKDYNLMTGYYSKEKILRDTFD